MRKKGVMLAFLLLMSIAALPGCGGQKEAAAVEDAVETATDAAEEETGAASEDSGVSDGESAGTGGQETEETTAAEATEETGTEAPEDGSDAFPAEAGEMEGAVVINQNYSHADFIDNIAFILPEGWTYELYEKINAGEDMDLHEWGVYVYVDGETANRITIYGGGEEETVKEEPAGSFQTGSGLTGQKYQPESGDGGVSGRYVFDRQEGDFALYRVKYTLTEEAYEKYGGMLDGFVLGIHFVSVARESE